MALKKNGRTEGDVFPSITRLTNNLRAPKNSFPPLSVEVLMRSFRCYRERPSGPPADLLEKELMIKATSFSNTGVAEAWSPGMEGCTSQGVDRVILTEGPQVWLRSIWLLSTQSR